MKKFKLLSLLIASVVLIAATLSYVDAANRRVDSHVDQSYQKNELLEMQTATLPLFDTIQNESVFGVALEKFTYDELYDMGYSKSNIIAMEEYRDYPISEIPSSVLARVGANCTISLHKLYHNVSSHETSAGMKATWRWNKAPLFLGSDVIAFSWGEQFSLDRDSSYAEVEFLNENGLVLDSKTLSVDDLEPNRGCSFKYNIGSHLGISRGEAYVYISKAHKKIYDFEAKASYGYETFLGNVSMYWSGINISFSPSIKEMDRDFIRFRK